MSEHDQTALCEAGRLLFGTRWQSDLARALGSSTRMMRYWVAGTHTPPSDLNQRLSALLQKQIEQMRDMIARLEDSKGDENNERL